MSNLLFSVGSCKKRLPKELEGRVFMGIENIDGAGNLTFEHHYRNFIVKIFLWIAALI
jgi:hypothetical protein